MHGDRRNKNGIFICVIVNTFWPCECPVACQETKPTHRGQIQVNVITCGEFFFNVQFRTQRKKPQKKFDTASLRGFLSALPAI